MVNKKQKDNIAKLEVVKENNYYGFERRDDEIRRDKDNKQLKTPDLEKEQALARVKELEDQQESLEIPINEHVLYYSGIGAGFLIVFVTYSLTIMEMLKL